MKVPLKMNLYIPFRFVCLQNTKSLQPTPGDHKTVQFSSIDNLVLPLFMVRKAKFIVDMNLRKDSLKWELHIDLTRALSSLKLLTLTNSSF